MTKLKILVLSHIIVYLGHFEIGIDVKTIMISHVVIQTKFYVCGPGVEEKFSF